MPNLAIIIVDPLGNFDFENPAVINRHRFYFEELTTSTNVFSTFSVLTCGKKPTLKKYDTIDINVITRTRKNFLGFILQATKIIKKNYSGKCVLIAPDPTLAFIACRMIAFILRFNCKKQIPIQLQIHADYSLNSWLTPKYLLIRAMWKFSIRRAHQIRFVGQSQFENIQKTFSNLTPDVFVAPVPLLFSESRGGGQPLNRGKDLTVAFVGRIHKERGLENFLQILRRMEKLNQEFDVIVIGEGPSEREFIVSIQKIVGVQRTRYLGWLSSQALEKIWPQITVLVNSSPSESYGRTMREALFHCTKVLATETSGARDLMRYISPRDLYIYDPSTLIQESRIQDLVSTPCEDYRKLFQDESENSVKQIVLQWRLLAENYYKEF